MQRLKSKIAVRSIVTDIATHNYLKKRMRFVSGQGILELKETRGKTRSGKWRLPSLIMCMHVKEYFSMKEE